MPPANETLTPGSKTVRDENGKVTSFAGFKVIASAEEVEDEWGSVFGIYGKGGSGKTTLIGQLADPSLNPEGHDCPVGVLDAEAGIKSVKHLLGERMQDLHLPTFSDLEKFANNWAVSTRKDFPWKSLAVDNLSEYVNSCLQEGGYHGQRGTSSQPDYNVMTTRVTDTVRKLRDCALKFNVNLFLLLWEATERTESGVVIAKKADLTPKLSVRIQGMLDYIGYLTIEKDIKHTRKLTFAPNDATGVTLDAKRRCNPSDPAMRIPFEVYNPNMVEIMATIRRGEAFPAEKHVKK